MRMVVAQAEATHQPEIVASARMWMFFPLLCPFSLGHTTHLHSFIDRRGGEVYVEAGAVGQAAFEYLFYNLYDVGCAGLKVGFR